MNFLFKKKNLPGKQGYLQLKKKLCKEKKGIQIHEIPG